MGSLDAPSDQAGKLILDSRFSVLYATDRLGAGYLLYRKETALVAQPFDTDGLQLTDEAFTVVPRVGSLGPVLAASISDNGMLAYSVDGAFDSNTQLARFDRGGQRLGEVGAPAAYREISLSPDGKKLAIALGEANNEQSIWLLDLGPGGGSDEVHFPADDVPSLDAVGARRIALTFHEQHRCLRGNLREAD